MDIPFTSLYPRPATPMNAHLRRRFTLLALLATLTSGLAGPARADTAAPAPEAALARVESTSQRAMAALQQGPRDIPLGTEGHLRLPAGYGFVPKAEAAALLAARGNTTAEGFHGLIVSDALDGFLVLQYEKAGHVKDEEARDWDAAKLLENLKEGTEAGNAERRRLGLPEYSVLGWVEVPAYDAATHRLVWSASTRSKEPREGGDGDGVNYNTYVLGREGYFSMNLVTSLAALEQEKPAARQLLAALEFNDGQRYADFNATTDKVAEYGLAALVGGIAAKKLGLLATLGIFLAKFWKVGALALMGGGAALRRFLGKKDAA